MVEVTRELLPLRPLGLTVIEVHYKHEFRQFSLVVGFIRRTMYFIVILNLNFKKCNNN